MDLAWLGGGYGSTEKYTITSTLQQRTVITIHPYERCWLVGPPLTCISVNIGNIVKYREISWNIVKYHDPDKCRYIPIYVAGRDLILVLISNSTCHLSSEFFVKYRKISLYCEISYNIVISWNIVKYREISWNIGKYRKISGSIGKYREVSGNID